MDRKVFVLEQDTSTVVFWKQYITEVWLPIVHEAHPILLFTFQRDPSLARQMASLVHTRRFVQEDYPFWIGDNVQAHTARAMRMAGGLPGFTATNAYAISQILLIHDIMEGGQNDQTVLQKQALSPDQKLLARQQEAQAAQRMITDQDWLKRLDRFNAAEAYLHGEITDYNLRKLGINALTAKLLDTNEGNIFFHNRVTSWLCRLSSSPFLHFPDEAYLYAFTIYPRYREKLENLLASADEKHANHLRLLIAMSSAVEEVILDLWKQVPEAMVPEVIGSRLKPQADKL